MVDFKKFTNFVNGLMPLNSKPELDKFINQLKNNKMGNLSHIYSVKKADAFLERIVTLWKKNKPINDYFSNRLKTKKQEERQYPILYLYKKRYNTPQIGDLFNFELPFIKKLMIKSNG